jgi:putative membrane protein
MSTSGLISVIAAALLISSGCSNSTAKDADNGTAASATAGISSADQRFAESAAASGQLEVEHAQAAQANASSGAVKDYAARLHSDHQAANQQLAALLERKNISVGDRSQRDDRGSIGARNDATTATRTGGQPTGSPSPTGTTGASGTVATTGEARDRERAGMTQPWMQATGAEFDEGYLAEQIKMHQDAIALFDQQSRIGTDPELKAFAAAQLPALREHLRQAEELQRTARKNP